jgi:excisionase family DNA binding protein
VSEEGKPCPFLRVSDIAGILGLSLSRTYAMLARGDLPATRVGGRWVVPRAAWEAWLSAKATDAASAVRPSR